MSKKRDSGRRGEERVMVKTRDFYTRSASFVTGICVAFTAVLIFIMYTPFANYAVAPLVVGGGELIKTDAIVALGGGAYGNGTLNAASSERMLRAVMLYRKGWAPRIIFSGGTIVGDMKKIVHTVIKTNRASDIGVVDADIMKETAVSLGVPAGDIVVDGASTNTQENLKNVKTYMEQNGLKSCIIVTSSTHIYRAVRIARRLGINFIASPSDDYTRYMTGAVGRLQLFRIAAWEYSALALYKIYGYI